MPANCRTPGGLNLHFGCYKDVLLVDKLANILRYVSFLHCCDTGMYLIVNVYMGRQQVCNTYVPPL